MREVPEVPIGRDPSELVQVLSPRLFEARGIAKVPGTSLSDNGEPCSSTGLRVKCHALAVRACVDIIPVPARWLPPNSEARSVGRLGCWPRRPSHFSGECHHPPDTRTLEGHLGIVVAVDYTDWSITLWDVHQRR